MKRHLANLAPSFILMVIAMALLDACGNNDPADAGKGADRLSSFPQRASDRSDPGSSGFVAAARTATPGVAHIRTVYEDQQGAATPFGNAYDRGNAVPRGSGSGVVISKDGYIATNNHVVENASRVEVVLPDRRSFVAKVIGSDPNTDLALLKVDAKDLSFVALGNSDDVQVGEWVLAVGYPYSLNTTVTAGIISAKGRSIGIINRPSRDYSQDLQANTAIESFLQTDAAINPGNSGGALVNMKGELIGINTAIASLTGSYAGYAFAVPVNLAKKILDDLKAFGKVKRGLLGVSFPAPVVEEQYLKQQGIDPAKVKGVFITGIQKGSAADEAGLQEGDVIQHIDSIRIFSSAEFSEWIARHRPGDKITLSYLRNGKSMNTTATLKEEGAQRSLAGDPQSLKMIYDKLGARFSPLSDALKERFRLNAGVVVSDIRVGGFFDRLGIPPGTIIVYINGKVINSPHDIEEALVNAQNSRVQILGVAPDGSRIAFNFSLGA